MRRKGVTTFMRLARVAVRGPGTCIVVTTNVDKQGYTRIYDVERGEKVLAHRAAHEVFIGPIPDGYQVDHLCGTRNCINPLHLEAVTPLVNTRRSAGGNFLKTHCDHGHEFTPENTRVDPRRGGRICRRCDADRAASYRARRDAA